MRVTLTAFGHTLTIDTANGCPDRAELDQRVRPEAFGFRA